MSNLYLLPIVEELYNYKYEIALDGTAYIIHFQYNSRKDGWFVSLYDYSDNLLIAGIKVKLGSDLLEQFRYIEGLPSGILAVSNFADYEEAKLSNFGSKVSLAYIGDS